MKFEEALQKFLTDKEECLIYVSSMGGIIEATITEIGDGWIRTTDKENTESIINLANVIRVREYPKNKNGKKKLIVT